MATRAAANFFFFFLVKKITEIFGEKKSKIEKKRCQWALIFSPGHWTGNKPCFKGGLSTHQPLLDEDKFW